MIPKNVPRFEDLGLPQGVRSLAQEHRGLVLVTGATGSGKTTTLAAMIDFINRSRESHIVTIEDPIEILHPDHRSIVNQREVGLDTENFGQALRRALRQDPDTILIGELRDAETAQTALQAAESGHLVFSTLHTVDAAETVGRMIEFFPEGKQVQIRSIMAGVLRGVISQRLLPRVGGGRVAAVEVMINNSRIGDLIRENKPEEITDAVAEGDFFHMQTFQKALIDRVIEGAVDREVAANASSNRHDFMVALEYAEKAHEMGIDPTAPAAAAIAEPEPVAGAGARADAAPRAARRMRRLLLVALVALVATGAASADTFEVVGDQPAASTRHCAPERARPERVRRHVAGAPRSTRRAAAARLVRPACRVWQAAGQAYGVPWSVLAAINKIESDFGQNMGPSSAGAIGWMQFMPDTWARWGVDANGDGLPDPWNAEDAIYSAARYLAATGGTTDISSAVFSYNHAQWYVDEVLQLAQQYAGGSARLRRRRSRPRRRPRRGKQAVLDANQRVLDAQAKVTEPAGPRRRAAPAGDVGAALQRPARRTEARDTRRRRRPGRPGRGRGPPVGAADRRGCAHRRA